jgi:hypothetical protein
VFQSNGKKVLSRLPSPILSFSLGSLFADHTMSDSPSLARV